MASSTAYGIADGLQNATNTLLQVQMFKQKMAHEDKQQELQQEHMDAQYKYLDAALEVKASQGDINADIKRDQLKEQKKLNDAKTKLTDIQTQIKKFGFAEYEKQAKADAIAQAQSAQQDQGGQPGSTSANPAPFFSAGGSPAQPPARWVMGVNGPRQVQPAGGMQPADVDKAARLLASGKEVPSQLSGFSKQKQQVINRAMELNPDYDPAKSDMEFAVNKMGAGAFVKNYNNLDSFHQDFELNSDYLLKLSKNFDRSQIPLLNRALVTGANEIQGNPQATQVLQAVNTVANGYARLQNPTLGGQALSDAARKEAQGVVSAFYSDKQMRALLDPETGSMRIDAQNRMTAAKNVKDKLMGSGDSVKKSNITLPDTVKTTSQAVDYLMKNNDMSKDEAIDWIRKQ